MNPFSNRGQLRYSSFLITVMMATALNLLIFLSIRGHLISARVHKDISLGLSLYVAWFLFFSLGFYIISNAFVKRWAAILGDRDLGSFWKMVLRVSLLSPVLSYALTLMTLLYFPGSLFRSVGRGGSRLAILSFTFIFLLASVVSVAQLPRALFGLERVHFQKASAGFEIELPEDNVAATFLSVASPALRYLSWLALDFVRARSIMDAITAKPESLCRERLGYVGVEVDDCFFRNFRNSAEIAPMISPYFGLFFETKYRQQTMKDRTPVSNLALNLLMLSNLLELVEPGPSFVDRRHLLKPAPLLFGFGSPEVPLVELGQDFQRYMLVNRMLPVFDLQFSTAGDFLKQDQAGATLQAEGVDPIQVEKELRDLQIRIESIRRDPLGIASYQNH